MAYIDGKIPLPNYPSGSHNFLNQVEKRHWQPKDGTNGHVEPTIDLDVAIIGAGVGGLSAAIAIKRAGFNVTVYQAASVLSEIGAGIQVPPNSARLLHSWGLESELRKKSVRPEGLIWRRWQSGDMIGHTRLNPQFFEWFGAPYYVIHRAHLHEVLHHQSVRLSVKIRLASRVIEYDQDEPMFTLSDGSVIRTDLIVAADGIRSMARRKLLGEGWKDPQSCGLAAYRAAISVDDIRANTDTVWVAESRSLNLWVGHNTHAMTYSIAGGKIFNMVLTHEDDADPRTWNQKNALTEMKATYEGWDPSLTKLLDMVTSTQKWSIQQVEIPEIWSSRSGRLVLLGDAAHAMLPNMALGAAMAVEDAATLAECLKRISRKDALGHAVGVYESLRVPRTKLVQEASLLHGNTLHYPDGPIQEARDAAMRPEVEGKHFIASPNQWSDPMTQLWCYTYDLVEEVRENWREPSPL